MRAVGIRFGIAKRHLQSARFDRGRARVAHVFGKNEFAAPAFYEIAEPGNGVAERCRSRAARFDGERCVAIDGDPAGKARRQLRGEHGERSRLHADSGNVERSRERQRVVADFRERSRGERSRKCKIVNPRSIDQRAVRRDGIRKRAGHGNSGKKRLVRNRCFPRRELVVESDNGGELQLDFAFVSAFERDAVFAEHRVNFFVVIVRQHRRAAEIFDAPEIRRKFRTRGSFRSARRFQRSFRLVRRKLIVARDDFLKTLLVRRRFLRCGFSGRRGEKLFGFVFGIAKIFDVFRAGAEESAQYRGAVVSG